MKFRMRAVHASCLLLVAQTLFGSEPDLSKQPDPTVLRDCCRSGGLEKLRATLGAAIANQWKPSHAGRPGSSGQRAFAAWVDLYGWIDLLSSDEAAVTKRWLSRHLTAGPKADTPGKSQQVTVLQSGAPLVRRYDRDQHYVTERISGDPAMLAPVMGGLIAQPFSPRNGPLIGRLDPEFVSETVSDPAFLALWTDSLSADDFAPKVLLNLQTIWETHRSDWHEFLPLAIAVAVVMDQPPPTWWPHHQVLVRNIPLSAKQPDEVFARVVSSFRNGKLRMDPRTLSVGELKFVIDAPLASSEFESVQNTPSLARLDPSGAFASIAYDKGRVIKDVFIWPWGAYTLAQIRKHGGICVDQAYYASVLAKSLGIPSLFFAGQGKDGGHAWVGYLNGSRRWNLGVGRYQDQNYAAGEALDPQNWAPVTDHDIDWVTRRLGNPERSGAARRDLIVAWNFRRSGNAPAEGSALGSALATSPENPEYWDALEDWLVRTDSPQSELRAHHERAIKQFSGFRDVKTQHQEALVRLATHSGDRTRAESISRTIVQENRGTRTDLSSVAASELILAKISANDPKGASDEFYRQLQLQGGNAGGDFFNKVLTPVATEFITRGRRDLALAAIKKTFVVMKPAKGSVLDKDFRKLWKSAGGAP
jgi:hypothetical protein